MGHSGGMCNNGWACLQCQALQAYSPIATTTGEIHSRYNRLHDRQKKDRLHAANKLTDKHVYFENHKMSLMSRSLSVVLRTMRDLGYLKNCESTAEFIEVIQ